MLGHIVEYIRFCFSAHQKQDISQQDPILPRTFVIVEWLLVNFGQGRLLESLHRGQHHLLWNLNQDRALFVNELAGHNAWVLESVLQGEVRRRQCRVHLDAHSFEFSNVFVEIVIRS